MISQRKKIWRRYMITSEQIKELEAKGYKVKPWNKKPTEAERCKLPLIYIKDKLYLVEKEEETKW